MLHSLSTHERVNRGQRIGVRSGDDHFAATRKIVIAVYDHIPLLRHHRRARHGLHVHELRGGEVASLKGVLDESKMCTNLRDAKGVVQIPQELDAAAVRKGRTIGAGRRSRVRRPPVQ
jgi:hypothetical protein